MNLSAAQSHWHWKLVLATLTHWQHYHIGNIITLATFHNHNLNAANREDSRTYKRGTNDILQFVGVVLRAVEES